MSKRSWNQVKVASKASKKGLYEQHQFWPIFAVLALALLYFAELAFSLSFKHGKCVELHNQPIWHPIRHMEADLEPKFDVISPEAPQPNNPLEC